MGNWNKLLLVTIFQNIYHHETKARLPDSPTGGLEEGLEIHSSVNYRFLLLGTRKCSTICQIHLYTH
jgi:hypothetical protein